MTGDEHYQLAELLLRGVSDKEVRVEVMVAVAAKAQVHATLALAAATSATGHIRDGYGS